MKIIFFGSSEFAIPPLGALISQGHEIPCVVTQPDRLRGRHLRIEGTPVKNLAGERGLKNYQPEDINSEASIRFLKSLPADLFIIIAYGQILSQTVLDIPRIFAINLHASLLPKYRGAAPINRAIIRGEDSTGVTVMKMVRKMDAGPIIKQSILQIGAEDNAVSLEEKLSVLGSKILLESLRDIENNSYKLTPQDEKAVSFAPKLKKEDGLINWDTPAQDIHNLARGCLPWPGAFTYYKGKILKIFRTGVLSWPQNQRASVPGTIKGISRNQIVVATKKDDLTIQELQPEGKREMSAGEFLSGHKIKAGEMFDKKTIA